MKEIAVLFGAFAASGMEFAEAALVVLVVMGRGQRRAALIGASAAAAVVTAVAVALGPKALELVPLDRLRQVLGAGLLLLGGFWLLQVILRPQAARKEIEHEATSAQRWAQRGAVASALVSAKAVGVEGAEAAVLVVAIGGPQHALMAATIGAVLAAVVIVGLARWLEPRLNALATHALNRAAGTALVLVGTFWLSEGSHFTAPLTAAILVPAGP